MLKYFSETKGPSQQIYSPQDFLFRWKKLQRIIQKEGLSGLLLITGMDGGQIPETSYLFNWLFLGLSGKHIFLNRYLDTIYSEMVICVGNKQSWIFLTPQAKKALNHLLAILQNCHVFVPTEKEYEDKELLDTLKIKFFYQMTNKLKKVGVYLEESKDGKAIEKWSMIQSYALEPIGNTFFTLKHEAINICSKIVPLYKNLDKHSLKNLVSQTCYNLQGHIRGSTQIIQLTEINERNKISEVKLQESLVETADIQNFETGAKNQNHAVRVLFGGRAGGKLKSENNITIGQEKAHHFTVEHFDPYTKIQVCRSYFLEQNKKESFKINMHQKEEQQSFLVKTNYVIDKFENPSSKNKSILLSSYLALVQTVIDSIGNVSKDYKNLTKDFLTQQIFSKINPQITALYGSEVLKKDSIEVELESYDSMGQFRPIDFKDSVTFKLTSTFYVLKCRLKNIKSKDLKSNLGSLIFSECFLLQQGCYLLLTKNIPYFDFWKCDHQENNILEKLNPNIPFEELGSSISNQTFKNRLYIPLEKTSSIHFNIPIFDIKYYFHEKGLRIFCQKFGWKLILYSQILDASMVNKISGNWVLLKMKDSFLFDSIQNNIIAIEFRGKAFEHLLKKVNDKTIPLNFLDVIPPLLAQNWYFSHQILKRQHNQKQTLHQHQIIHNEFLWKFIEAKQLMILNQMKDIKLSMFRQLYQQKAEGKFEEVAIPKDKHSIIVICGGYGGGKEKLAKNLSRFGPVKFKYHSFVVPSECLYNKIQPSVFLEMLDEHIKDNQVPTSQQNLVLVTVPSWLSLPQLLPKLTQKYHIRSVLTKITVSTFYTNSNQELAENILTYGLPGYSQSIVLDSHGQDEKQIDQITRILWHFNRQAKIMRGSNSMLSTGQCADIISNNLYTTEYHNFLRIKYGSLYKFDAVCQLSVNYIEFKLPTFDLSPLKRLTQKNGFLFNYESIKQELKPKLAQAENSKDELMLALYKIEEAITFAKRMEKSIQIRNIRGKVQLHGEKGATEVSWTNGMFKERTIPESQRNSFGFFILSRNYDEGEVRQFLQSLSYKKYAFEGIKPLVSEQSLTEQKIAEIQRQGRGKYLDNGQFFDGYFFRNVEGQILQEHPNLNKLIKEWVEEKNKQTRDSNEKIKVEWENYCKQYK